MAANNRYMTGEQLIRKAAPVRVRNMSTGEALAYEGRRLKRMGDKVVKRMKDMGKGMMKRTQPTPAQMQRVYMESGKRKRTP